MKKTVSKSPTKIKDDLPVVINRKTTENLNTLDKSLVPPSQNASFDDNSEIVDALEPEVIIEEPIETTEQDFFSEINLDVNELATLLLPGKGELIPSAKEKKAKGTKDIIPFDPLQKYLSEIRNIPQLTREEEHQLALKYQSGDSLAGYKLVLANLRLVVIIAREYQKNFHNIMDLVQEGNIGLLEAVKQYDPLKGIRFPSYAVYWVRAYMLRYIINNMRLVKIGTTQAQRKLFFNLQKEKEKLEAEGFYPEARLLAERLQVKESEVIEMDQRLGLPDLSVDTPLNGEEDTNWHSIIPDKSVNTEASIIDKQFKHELIKVVEEFKVGKDLKEIAIIEKRLFAEDSLTLQEIADQFGVTRERIRQIETKVKSQLKAFLLTRFHSGELDNFIYLGES